MEFLASEFFLPLDKNKEEDGSENAEHAGYRLVAPDAWLNLCHLNRVRAMVGKGTQPFNDPIDRS